MKKIAFFLLLAVIFGISCQQKRAGGGEEEAFLCVTDSYGREVRIEREPQRVISLSPCLTEIIYLLGCEKKLVGVSDFCDFPPQVADIQHVGGLVNLNIEALVALNPDLILISSIVTKAEVEQMERLGIPVVAVKEERAISGLCAAVRRVGEVLNAGERASEVAQQLENQIDSLRASAAAADTTAKLSCYYVVGFGAGGDFTAPRESHIHDIITLAGKRNIGEALTTWSVSREYLFEEDPDIIVIRAEDLRAFCSTFPYSELGAVRRGRVYPIESGWIDIVSPRNVDAVHLIHQCK